MHSTHCTHQHVPSEVQQGAVHKPDTKMSLEDVESDFQSDESDYEAEKNLSDADDEPTLLELVHMHFDLMCFEHIYNNNAVMDMQVGLLMVILIDSTNYSFNESIINYWTTCLKLTEAKLCFKIEFQQYTENEVGPSGDLDSLSSELALINDYIGAFFEDLLSTNSSGSSSAISDENGSGSDSEESALSSVQDFVQLYEECISTYSSASDAAGGQTTNEGDTDSLQDGAVEGQMWATI